MDTKLTDGSGDVRVKPGDRLLTPLPSDPATPQCLRVDLLPFDRIPKRSRPYLASRFSLSDSVPEGHVWLSSAEEAEPDSRDFGPVPLSLVKGRVLWQCPS